jgi:predicted TIM-barrel fold metal-dependent hydrolase
LKKEENMIIDIHSHIGDPWYAYWQKMVTVEEHLNSMDKYGVAKRCISWQNPHHAPDHGNATVAEVVKKYPDRFLGFAVINPRWYKGAVDEVERAKNDLGMIGLKLHPAACQFHADSPCLDKVMEKAIEVGFPVLFHCGLDEYSHPRNLGNLAGRFPKATIIMGHMGERAWFEGIATAGKYNNIVLDASACSNFYRVLNFAVETVGEDRIVFGMDFPAINPGPEIAKVKDADLTEKQKQKIFAENAARILGLKI